LKISAEGKAGLFVGPDGTGKSVLAQAIHQRENGPLVRSCPSHVPISRRRELEETAIGKRPKRFFAQPAGGVLVSGGYRSVVTRGSGTLVFQWLFGRCRPDDPLHKLGQSSYWRKPLNVQVMHRHPGHSMWQSPKDVFAVDLFYLVSKVTVACPPLTERLEDIRFWPSISCQEFVQNLA